MLNTAATMMYWKQETRKSAVFSKFVDSNLFPSPTGPSVGGGVYLSPTFSIVQGYVWTHSPYLVANPDVCPYLHSPVDDHLPDNAHENLFRHQTSCGSFGVDVGKG